MALREPLVSFVDGEPLELFAERALHAAREQGGSGRLRLEVGPVWWAASGSDGFAGSLWVERGTGTTESWQRVTPSTICDSYTELLAVFARILEADTLPPF